MAIVKDEEKKSQKDEPDRDDRDDKSHDDRRPAPEQPRPASEGGFFHIYKSGQGYWTRMGTAGAAALVAALTAHFIYYNLYAWIGAAGTPAGTARKIAIGVAAGFLALFGVSDRPVRATGAEQALMGRGLADGAAAAAEAAMADLDPKGDAHASAEYRREVTGVLVRRAIEQAASGGRTG